MPGKFKGLLLDFIESIPESKLTGFSESIGPVWETTEFRLDMQGMTSDGRFNLQIQANRGAKSTTVRLAAPKTVAGPVFIGRDEEVSAEEVRRMFKERLVQKK